MRGVHISINFKVRAEEFLSHTVTVCRVCYDVAIAEHQLMELEKQFARQLSIPVQDKALELDIGGKKNVNLTHPVLSNPILTMWRVMFYFDYLTLNGIFPIISLKKENISMFNKNKEYYLQFRFLTHITKFPINICPEPNTNRSILNKLRIHYFLSDSQNIDETLQNIIAEIRITEGPVWENIVFCGKSLILTDFFPDYMRTEASILPKISYLFDPAKINKNIQIQVFFFSDL